MTKRWQGPSAAGRVRQERSPQSRPASPQCCVPAFSRHRFSRPLAAVTATPQRHIFKHYSAAGGAELIGSLGSPLRCITAPENELFLLSNLKLP